MDLDAAEDAQRDSRDRSITAKTSAPEAVSGEGQDRQPDQPEGAGNEQPDPGRNIAYTGIVDCSRASWYATNVITTAPTKPLE